MARLLELTHKTGHKVWLNADRIVKVVEYKEDGEVIGSRIAHDPYIPECCDLDYTVVKELPIEIVEKCIVPATVIHIPHEDYR